MAERDADVEGQHIVAPVLPGVLGQAVAEGISDILQRTAVTSLQLFIRLTDPPISLVATGQIKGAIVPNLLSHRHLQPPTLVVGQIVVIGEFRNELDDTFIG
ncbi:hypothetical protein D3C75_1021250 [compost metagenome]